VGLVFNRLATTVLCLHDICGASYLHTVMAGLLSVPRLLQRDYHVDQVIDDALNVSAAAITAAAAAARY
jgi:hypothetical protein